MKCCRVIDRQNNRDDFATAWFSVSTTSLQILVLVLIGVLALPSFATRCFWGSLEESFSKADVVVKARLRPGASHFLSRENSQQFGESEQHTTLERVAVVNVLKVWKGESTDTLTIHSETGHTAGYTIPENKTVILFASYGKRTTTDQDPEEASQENERPPLYTWYCSDNVELTDDVPSQSIEQKLDRLRRKAEEAHTGHGYREVLRERIREILKSVEDQPSHSVK